MPLLARVKGYIKDASGVGIAGANVTCAGVTTQSIIGGGYVLSLPVAGVQTITASMAGKTSVSVPVTLTAGGAATAPLITLK